MSLVTLAPELLEAICDSLDETAVRDLRLVCKTLAETLSQVVYRKLDIHFRQDRFEILLEKLQLLVDGKWPQATQGTRVLVLKSLSPRFNPDQPGPSWSYMNGGWQEIPDPPPAREALVAEARIRELLPVAIATLKGLHTVYWYPCRFDGGGTQAVVADAIVALPNLRHFTLDTTRYDAPLPLLRLPPLISLNINGSNVACDEVTRLGQVSECIARSPHLSSLTLVRDYHSRPGLATSFHYVLKNTNDSKCPPLNLTTLTLSGFYVRLDDTILPHLRNLRSLTIAGFMDPSHITLDSDVIDDENLPTVDNAQYAAPFPDLWKALKTVGVELSHLDVQHMSNALVEYIDSYSGLQALKIYIPDYSHDVKSPGADEADAFWDALGKRHGGTLRHLDVNSGCEGEFCFSRSRVAAVKQCKHLVSLSVPIVTSKRYQDEDSDLPKERARDVVLLLDTVAFHLPRLLQLTISATSSPSLRFARCGNASRSHFGRASKIMNQWVANYSAPTYCDRLPDLEIEVLHMHTRWKSLVRPDLDHVVGDASPSPSIASSRRLLHLEEDEGRQLVVPLPTTRQTTLAYQNMEQPGEAASEVIYL